MDGLEDSGAGRPPIAMVSEREVFGNRFVAIYDDDVLLPNNRPGRFLRIVEAGGRPGVAMLAQFQDRFALVKTYRYPIGDWEWAIPRGFAHGDDPQESALAELQEEIGGLPTTLTEMGVITANSGILAGRVHMFHAEFPEATADPIDTEEVNAVQWVDLPTLLADIASGALIDGFTMSAITMAAARGLVTLPATPPATSPGSAARS